MSFVLLTFAFFYGCKPKAKEAETAQAVESDISESIYQSVGKWDNQYGDTLELGKLKGKIPVISMIFTRCAFACPRIVSDIKAIEKAVPADKRDKVVFVLVSFDSDKDHTPELKAFAKKMHLGNNWMVLHGSEEDVRQLSMLLDIKYKQQLNGDFTHSSSVTLLDQKGIIVTRLDGLGTNPEPLLQKIKSL